MKNFRKLLSVFLVLATILVYYVAVPAKTIADDIEATDLLNEYVDATGFSKSAELVYSPLVGEVVGNRTLDSKTFRRADGAYEAVMYPFPVHFEDNGQWKNIDNTLIPITDEAGKVLAYQTSSSGIQVRFASSLDSMELVRYALSDDKYISWGIDGFGAADAITASGATDDAFFTDEQNDMALRFPEELSSGILYEDKENGFSIKYVLTSCILSEYITLNEKPTEKVVYKMTLNCVGLEPVRTADGSIAFSDGDGKEQLIMGKPVMDDAAGGQSDSFEVSLIEKTADDNLNSDAANGNAFGGTYTYTIEPDMDWLLSEDCVYPVVIDPDIKPLFNGNVEDTYISYDDQNTNYNTRDRLKIGGTPHYRSLVKISGLPTLEAGDVMVEATLNLSRYNTSSAYGKEIDLRQILTDWSYDTVTWSNFQPDSQTSVDRSRVESIAMTQTQNNFNIFDITRLVKYWYENPSENYGMLLESWKESSNWYTEYRSSNYNSTYSGHPYFSVIYINSTGLESRFTYHSQNVSRAGTGSVNDYSGNLVFSRADAGITNGTMPITISHVFNTNDRNEDIGYGNGWRLNYSQSVTKVTITNRTTTKTYYQLIDGDGTRHYYEPEGSSTVNYVSELDKDSKLTVNNGDKTITITDKSDNKLVFACDSSMENGRLIRIEDANGNQTLIAYTTTTITNLRISSVSEKLAANSGSCQSITLTYSGNRLYKVTPPDGMYAYYYYTSGNLTSVRNSDGKYCYYSYNANRCLTRAKNIDNYNVNYEYSSAAPYRVTKATEKANTTAGNYITFDYGWSTTTVTDNHGRAVIYQFDNNGQAVSVRDNEGGAVFAAYNSAEQTTTQISAVSNLQNTVFNLLMNHGFETTSGSTWTRSSTTYVTYSSTYQHTGKYSLKMISAAGRTVYATQSVAVTAGETYTLSGYFTGQSGAALQVLNGNTVIAASDTIETTGAVGADWTRASVRFTVPSGVSSVTIKLNLPSTSAGTLYVDSVQLEAGETPNRYNMLENADFTDGMTSWTTSSNISGATDGITADGTASHPTSFSDSVYHITGSCDYSKCIMQTITVNGKKGDAYSFGAWLRSDSVALNKQSYNNRLYGVKRVTIEFINSSGGLVNSVPVYFGADTTDWQYACGSAVASGVYAKVRISLNFHYTRNDCYYDGAQLFREEFSQAYSYDDSGNLTGYKSLIGQQTSFEYDADDNIEKATDPRGNTTNYTYDSKHNLLTSTSPEGVVTTNTYDTNGNVTQTQTGSAANYIRSQTEYDTASALATAVTDARGNSVGYEYNSATRQQTMITDALGNESTYSYGNAASMLRLASLTSDGTGTVNYDYDAYGKLTDISRGDTDYSFTYDAWGRAVSTLVGSTVISTNNYDENGRLSSVTYGNGFKIEYMYDSLDRTSRIYQRASANAASLLAYELIYDGEGNLYELRNYKTNRSVFFEYDHAGKCMASTEKSFTVSGAIISYTGTVAGYEYEYDVNNNLTKLSQTVSGRTWSVTYTYDKDNRPKTATLVNGVVITNNYDAIGRLSTRTVKLSATNTYTTTLTYVSGTNGSKTALVSVYQNGSDAKYNYAYDANGNTTQIWRGSSTFASATEKYSYVYDAANQLIRENLYYGSGNNNNNATYVYEYDDWGNILRKLVYPYTTGEVTIPPKMLNVTYDEGIGHYGEISDMPQDLGAVEENATITISDSIPASSNGADFFAGWNLDPNAAQQMVQGDDNGLWYYPGDEITVTEDMTLYAIWAWKNTVTYHANVQSGDTAYGIPAAHPSGDSIPFTVLPDNGATPTTELGAIFLGWTVNADGTGTVYEPGQILISRNNVELYAKWDYSTAPTPIPQFTLTYDGNAPANATVTNVASSMSYSHGAQAAVTATIPVCDEYDFAEWNTAADGTGTSYEGGDSITMTANVTLYAQWTTTLPPTPIPCTIVFEPNASGVTNMPNAMTVGRGTIAPLPINIPIRSSLYIFMGWNTRANGTGTTYQPRGSIFVTENITLYAIWEISGGIVPRPTPTSAIMGLETPAPPISESDEQLPARNGSGINPIQTIQYVYDNAEWQDQLIQIKTYSVSSTGAQTLTNTQTIAYDAMGNPTSYLGKTLSWEGKQLSAVTASGQSITYSYDENGLRTQKTVNGTTTNYYYNGSVLIGMTQGSTTQRFSFDSSGSVVSVNYNGTEYYYVRNGQGDVIALINDSGTKVVSYTYDTWGKQLSCTGSLSTTLGQNQPFRYRAYVYDTETGWYYLQSRYYNPTACRWISPEPNAHSGGFDIGAGIIGYGIYTYCANNPANMVDPAGEFIISTLLICIGAGVLVGGTVGGVAGCMYANSKGYTGRDKTRCILMGVGFGGIAGGALGYFSAPAIIGITGVAGISVTSAGVSTIAAIGTSIGKLGTLIANNGQQLIDWGKTTLHGIQRMAERGVTQSMVETWVRTGKAIQQTGDKILYITQQGAVVVSKSGQVITAYTSRYFDATMQKIIELLFGK